MAGMHGCQPKPHVLCRHVVTIDGHEDVPADSEADLAKAVAHQPVSVAICASDLQFYGGGIVSTCCDSLDHGVLAVGYGTVRPQACCWQRVSVDRL